MGENSSGFTNEQSLLGGAFSRDLVDQKSKSLLFPGPGGGGGGGGMVTNDLCIMIDKRLKDQTNLVKSHVYWQMMTYDAMALIIFRLIFLLSPFCWRQNYLADIENLVYLFCKWANKNVYNHKL